MATRAGLTHFREDAEHDRMDVISVAWEFWSMRPELGISTHVWYAVKHVRRGRQFPMSNRSVDAPCPSRERKQFHRKTEELLTHCSLRCDPAELALFLIDFAAWQRVIGDRKRRMVKAMLAGLGTKRLAQRFKVSPVRISQIRRELMEHWIEFTS